MTFAVAGNETSHCQNINNNVSSLPLKKTILAGKHPSTFFNSDELTFNISHPIAKNKEDSPNLESASTSPAELSPNGENNWLVGDIIWGRLTGYPWWPAMITYDPFLALYVKHNVNTKAYHVQFFGKKVERAWLNSSRIVKFESIHQMNVINSSNNVNRLKKSVKRKSDPGANKVVRVASKLPEKARVPTSLKQLYNSAIVDVSSAILMSKQDRIKRFSMKFEDAGKIKIEHPTSKHTSRNSTNNKRNRNSDLDQVVSLKNKRQRLSQTYDSYIKEMKPDVQKNFPHYSESDISNYLNQQWSLKSESEKLKYDTTDDEALPSLAVSTRSQTKTKDKIQLTSTRSRSLSVPPERELRSTPLGVITSQNRKSLRNVSITNQKEPYKSTNVGSSVPARLKVYKDLRSRSPIPSISEDDVIEQANANGHLTVDADKITGSRAAKKEYICKICEMPGELLLCEGDCCGAFHLLCIGLAKVPDGQYKCDECLTSLHSCFVCKIADLTVVKCSISVCGKYYHENCLKSYTLARYDQKGNLICPLHACISCAAIDGKTEKCFKGKMQRCVRCPTAYHANDRCIAAGSVVLAQNAITCCAHFQPTKTNKHHAHVNVSWCFSCSRGGELICCDQCPASYHLECIKLAELPQGSWICDSCACGLRPRYNDLVWVKLGVYRWWPAEVCHPKAVPNNIQELSHQVGEFPVRFFGSHDYFWIHIGRTFAFHEDDRAANLSSSKSINRVFQLAVKEASKRFEDLRRLREEHAESVSNKKPANYKLVTSNRPVGKVQVFTADVSEISPCECKITDSDPCGPSSQCWNRLLCVECHPKVCHAKEKCSNQRFQKCQYPPFEYFKTDLRGWGLRSTVKIFKGDFVNEYCGDLIDREECQRRLKHQNETENFNFYFCVLDKDRIIDAGPRGNYSRFMNHSCDPNCETQKWTVNGDIRVGLFASRDIDPLEELTFNYNMDCLGNSKLKCSCNSANCGSYIGNKPERQISCEMIEKKVKKKKKKIAARQHENECFRCGDGGEIILCDRINCSKAYHLACLNLTELPHGKWDCPWHYCDACERAAYLKCTFCDNSYCREHYTGRIHQIAENTFSCNLHDMATLALQTKTSANDSPLPLDFISSQINSVSCT